MGQGQGFTKCSCTKSCLTRRCKCLKHNFYATADVNAVPLVLTSPMHTHTHTHTCRNPLKDVRPFSVKQK